MVAITGHVRSPSGGSRPLPCPNPPRTSKDLASASSLSSSPVTSSVGDNGISCSPSRRQAVAENTSRSSSRPRDFGRQTASPGGSGSSVRGFKVDKTRKHKPLVPVSVKSQMGLLGEKLSTAPGDPSPSHTHAQVEMQAKLTRLLSNEHSSKFTASPQWTAAKGDVENRALYHPHVQRAYIIASTVHEGQRDKLTGGPLMARYEGAAIIVTRLGLDAEAIAATLLQGVLTGGSSKMTSSKLREYLPANIVARVESVAHASRTTSLFFEEPSPLREELTAVRLRSMLVGLSDVQVMLIKLATRLHSARHLCCMPRDVQRRFLLTTETIYVPIANRLGVWSIKAELEDLCFHALHPEAYERLEGEVQAVMSESATLIARFVDEAAAALRSSGIDPEDVEGRPKSLSSIRSKLQRKAGPKAGPQPCCVVGGCGSAATATEPVHDLMHDMLAVRVIVSSKAACYEALRTLSARWLPHAGCCIKDYIRSPKDNGYQSLHAVLVADGGVPIEVQIRTPAMHWNAEFGVAAHWRYKECRGSAAGGGGVGGSAECVEATYEHIVAWTRMVLAYGVGIKDWRKSRAAIGPGRGSTLRRCATLTNLTHSLMATAGGPPMAAAPAAAEAPTSSATQGGVGALCALRGSQARIGRAASAPPASRTGRTFRQYVADTLLQPVPSVLVTVSGESGARIQALDAAHGSGEDGRGGGGFATVRQLLASAAVPAGTEPEQLSINGAPCWGPDQRLGMCDVVDVSTGATAPRLTALGVGGVLRVPWMNLRRELFGVIADAMRPQMDSGAGVATVATPPSA